MHYKRVTEEKSNSNCRHHPFTFLTAKNRSLHNEILDRSLTKFKIDLKNVD